MPSAMAATLPSMSVTSAAFWRSTGSPTMRMEYGCTTSGYRDPSAALLRRTAHDGVVAVARAPHVARHDDRPGDGSRRVLPRRCRRRDEAAAARRATAVAGR